jgi:RNA polymerase sigma factor (sigma-70 family)
VKKDADLTSSRDVLVAGIARLPEPQRQVVRLYVLERKSVDAIAHRLGMAVGEVETLVNEGRQRLRKLLTVPRMTLHKGGRS